MKICAICGRYEHTERHHIFGGAMRKKSEKLGLVVDLCPFCHRNGAMAAHRCRETQQMLHEYGQRLAMRRFNWTEEDFVREFYKNYLEPEAGEYGGENDFELLPAETLPF